MDVKRNINKYYLSYFLSSNALVMPILPIWWVNVVGVSTNAYLTIFAIASAGALLLDAPLSFIADYIGSKILCFFSLIILAIVFFLTGFWQTKISFLVCTFLSMIANALRSGANTTLLNDISSDDNFRSIFFKLNKYFYLVTGCAFFLGVFLYKHNSVMLFCIQGALFVVSAFILVSIKVNRKKPRNNAQKTSYNNFKHLNRIVKNVSIYYVFGVVALCLAIGYFNGVIQFQNRAIQLITNKLNLSFADPLWLSAIFFFVGNIITSLGSNNTLEYITKRASTLLVSICLFLIAFLACTALSIDTLQIIFFGYISLCFIKGLYRSEYTDLALNVSPSSKFKTTWLSVINTIAALMASFLNFIVANMALDNLFLAERLWAFIGIVLMLICAVLLIMSRKACIFLNEGMSQKKSYVLFSFLHPEKKVFCQKYPSKSSCEHTKHIVEHQEIVQPMKMAENIKTRKMDDVNDTLFYKYYEMDSLQVCDESERFDFLLNCGIINDLKNKKNIRQKTVSSAFDTHLITEIKNVCTCETFNHGDLNPTNILIDSDKYILVDWDLAGVSPRLLDEFSIVLHPDVPCSPSERITLFESFFNQHDEACPIHCVKTQVLINKLIYAKIKDIDSWTTTKEALALREKYKALLDDINAYYERLDL